MSYSLAVIHDLCFQEHHTPWGHPERAARLMSLEKLWVERPYFSSLPNLTFGGCALSDLRAIHHETHLRRVADTAGKEHVALDPDTHTSSRSFEVALLACGAAMRAVDAVMTQEHTGVFALVRPPGHHAERNKPMGFCLFNNIAHAASHARLRYGLDRVMIVDWDVHHGNGTQDIFYDDPHVLFCSTHQFPFYPGSGDFRESGRLDGMGFTVNVPMPAGLGDLDFQEVFEKIIVPVARQYQPQLILVSAGYDAFHLDPLGGQKLSEAGFARLTRILMDLSNEVCAGKTVFVLEGGYHLEGLQGCVAATLDTLLAKREGNKLEGNCLPVTLEVIEKVMRVHDKQWKF